MIVARPLASPDERRRLYWVACRMVRYEPVGRLLTPYPLQVPQLLGTSVIP